MKRLKILLVFSFLFYSSICFSQNRKGNIVEYFGKEKVEDIHEGEVIHLFKKGLLYKTDNFSFATKAVLKDPLFARAIA